MTSLKSISELTTLATVDGAADLLAIVDSDASETKKITIDSLLSQEVWAGGTFTGDVTFAASDILHQRAGGGAVLFTQGGSDADAAVNHDAKIIQRVGMSGFPNFRHERIIQTSVGSGIKEQITSDISVGASWAQEFVRADGVGGNPDEDVMQVHFSPVTRLWGVYQGHAISNPIIQVDAVEQSVGLAGAAAPASGVLIDKMLDVYGPNDALAVIGDRGLEIGQSVDVNANNTCMIVGRNFTNVEHYPTALVAVANAPTEVRNPSGISSSVTIAAGATATGEVVGIKAGVINRGTIGDAAQGVVSTAINLGTTPIWRAFVAAEGFGGAGTKTVLWVGAGYDYLLESDDLDISGGGIVNFKGTMGNSAKDPTTDAPADWVEIEINGTTRYIPAYAA